MLVCVCVCDCVFWWEGEEWPPNWKNTRAKSYSLLNPNEINCCFSKTLENKIKNETRNWVLTFWEKGSNSVDQLSTENRLWMKQLNSHLGHAFYFPSSSQFSILFVMLLTLTLTLSLFLSLSLNSYSNCMQSQQNTNLIHNKVDVNEFYPC